MAPVEITDDYYDILKVPHTATFEVIKSSYRRLAIALHPDKNPNNLNATASFQKLARAYETIKDPEQRRIYDIRWIPIRNNQRTQQEAAEVERKRAAQEKADKQKEESSRQDRLRHLELHRSRYDGDIFEANRVVRRLVADLKRLQDQDDEELRKEKERNSWWTYMTSSIYSQPKETENQKQEREIKRLQRLASRSIKENELTQRKAKLQSLQDALQKVNSKIAAEKKKEEDEARTQAAKRQEHLRKEQEAKRRREEEEMRERRARWEKTQQEQAAQAAKEAREAQERVRKAADERRKAEAEERARTARVEEAARKARDQQRGYGRKRQPWIDDAAMVHVLAMDPTIQGSQDFVVNSGGLDGSAVWDDALEIARKHYPEAVEKGILPLGGSTPAQKLKVDGSRAEKVFGFRYQDFEPQVVSLVGHYVDVVEKSAAKGTANGVANGGVDGLVDGSS